MCETEKQVRPKRIKKDKAEEQAPCEETEAIKAKMEMDALLQGKKQDVMVVDISVAASVLGQSTSAVSNAPPPMAIQDDDEMILKQAAASGPPVDTFQADKTDKAAQEKEAPAKKKKLKKKSSDNEKVKRGSRSNEALDSVI